jgi:hypothetical protein
MCRADGTEPIYGFGYLPITRADGTLLFQKILSIVEFFGCTTNIMGKSAT